MQTLESVDELSEAPVDAVDAGGVRLVEAGVRLAGRHLYLADSVESREYAYDLRPDGRDVRVGMTDADRDLYRRRIREQIGELAAWYRFTPER